MRSPAPLRTAEARTSVANALRAQPGNPRPTRAEVSDVTNAVCDGADAVMLSGESANGQYPVESVEMMQSIIAAAEADTAFHTKGEKMLQTPNSPYESTAWAAVAAVRQDQAKTIIIMSKTGETARLVAKYRPDVPVVCICANQKVARQLMLLRGCHPVVMENVPAKHLFRRAVDCKPAPPSRPARRLCCAQPPFTKKSKLSACARRRCDQAELLRTGRRCGRAVLGGRRGARLPELHADHACLHGALPRQLGRASVAVTRVSYRLQCRCWI